MNRMPGFTADNALYRTRGRYATTYLPGTAGKAEIVPQLYREETTVSFACDSTTGKCYCYGSRDCIEMCQSGECKNCRPGDFGPWGGSCTWK
jgi:hypothetical protein